MRLKRLTLIYPATILTFGGLGFVLLPEFTLDLLQSNQDYGDVMPRLVGMFMVGLGSLIGLFVARNDYTYYGYSIVARTGFSSSFSCSTQSIRIRSSWCSPRSCRLVSLPRTSFTSRSGEPVGAT